MGSRVVILGSAFGYKELNGRKLGTLTVETRLGPVTLHRYPSERDAFVLFRHGLPHRHLPHQIPYEAHALALAAVGCEALLVTSSVGVMDAELPLFEPLLVSDLLMTDNRLPDGRACTIFNEGQPAPGHLVLDEGLFSRALGAELERLAARPLPRVVFAYVGGPRTKTAAENRLLARSGAQVNSMTVGPEVVLANELGIATAALVVGHKYSVPELRSQKLDDAALSLSLVQSREMTETLAATFLEREGAPRFGNRIYRFGEPLQ